ncbi:MAG TPA: hypothetical protein ENN83_09700 [Rhodovulum sp.]|nr:hypothetical protein [Rhodovulum sp.]
MHARRVAHHIHRRDHRSARLRPQRRRRIPVRIDAPAHALSFFWPKISRGSPRQRTGAAPPTRRPPPRTAPAPPDKGQGRSP